eukprot:CAMPEP_0169145086 /NCGR_PEP_ID=MMETSP1015-20121227/46689_1 /TAXON_ID=342587 /ORGANISM="Karlodinium micrum, Strain CCMP2283" /LENGTH=62 /DNA_ID=CAMNT_0009212583 /DNA_START=922 /DNA_END=1110 /DNA_ORIENTATION=+
MPQMPTIGPTCRRCKLLQRIAECYILAAPLSVLVDKQHLHVSAPEPAAEFFEPGLRHKICCT